MVRKPDGVDENERLLYVLVKVPKKELDDQLAKRVAKALAKHKKLAKKRKK